MSALAHAIEIALKLRKKKKRRLKETTMISFRQFLTNGFLKEVTHDEDGHPLPKPVSKEEKARLEKKTLADKNYIKKNPKKELKSWEDR